MPALTFCATCTGVLACESHRVSCMACVACAHTQNERERKGVRTWHMRTVRPVAVARMSSIFSSPGKSVMASKVNIDDASLFSPHT
jgi:hypothetical protein